MNLRPTAQAYLLAFGFNQHFSKQAVPGEIEFYLRAMKHLGMFDPYEFGVQLGSALRIETDTPLKFGDSIITFVARKFWRTGCKIADPEIAEHRLKVFRAYMEQHKRLKEDTPSADLFYTAGRSEQKHGAWSQR